MTRVKTIGNIFKNQYFQSSNFKTESNISTLLVSEKALYEVEKVVLKANGNVSNTVDRPLLICVYIFTLI